MRIRVAILGLAGLMAINVSCAYASPKEVVLQPTTPWRVDFGDKACTLMRIFGTADHPFMLTMKSYAPGYTFETTLAGTQLDSMTSAAEWTIAYGSGFANVHKGWQTGKMDKYGSAAVLSTTLRLDEAPQEGVDEGVNEGDAPYPDAKMESQIDRIAVSTRSKKVIFNTGSMGKALAMMKKCSDAMVKDWGLDPDAQSSLARHVATTDKSWIRQIKASYPMMLGLQGKGARVTIRIMVDKSGKPTACDWIQAFANTNFKVAACDIILKSARFQPALDRSGQPIDSYYTTTILYKLA